MCYPHPELTRCSVTAAASSTWRPDLDSAQPSEGPSRGMSPDLATTDRDVTCRPIRHDATREVCRPSCQSRSTTCGRRLCTPHDQLRYGTVIKLSTTSFGAGRAGIGVAVPLRRLSSVIRFRSSQARSRLIGHDSNPRVGVNREALQRAFGACDRSTRPSRHLASRSADK